MTVGGVSVPGWPWAWVVLFLALYGLGDLCWWAAGRLRRAGAWWRDRPRVMWIRDWWYDRRNRQAPLEEPPPLAPERTWEQMTNHQYPGLTAAERMDFSRRERSRFVRAAAVEVEQRQAYAALGLEFPSGLMARVREAAQ